MKQHLQQLVQQAIESLQADGHLASDVKAPVQIEHARDKQHGDFACNIAMVLAKQVQMKPRDLAEKIVAALAESEFVEEVVIAGPGFINFFVSDSSVQSIIPKILKEKEQFGRVQLAKKIKINLEFVSANPTGPLHVGHGRSAAYGATLANLLEVVGYDVHCEYYVNDAGRQMDILATSVWLRYLQIFNNEFVFPTNAYRGDYVKDIAQQLKESEGDTFLQSVKAVYDNLPPDEPDGGDKELYIDALIARAKELLGESGYQIVHACGLDMILEDIRDDLAEFGVHYQEWFSEQSLKENGAIDRAIETVKEKELVYEQDGALWFKARDFGDEKDRVLIRENGQSTYFASDLAYHLNKFERGADQLIDIFGADHHGYVVRTKAGIQAMGEDPNRLTVLLVQFAILYRGKERVQMSTRSGSFVTLRELRKEVSNDAARYFYVMRKSGQHMDFDLELAKSHSSDNPVYYVQYAHARVCSVFRQLAEKSLDWDQDEGEANLTLLNSDYEKALLTELARYPEIIQVAASVYEPHQITNYLRDVAHCFHTYYNAQQFIVDDQKLRNARLSLITAVRQVLCNALAIIGISAPEKM